MTLYSFSGKAVIDFVLVPTIRIILVKERRYVNLVVACAKTLESRYRCKLISNYSAKKFEET